ncbi:MAG: hypothetical protein COB93_09835 [Sneathiella sp.]|nr:MAG: hypothetical protein COB93_09835 [Sneathiella sp.]
MRFMILMTTLALGWSIPAIAVATPFPSNAAEMLDVCQSEIGKAETRNRLPKHLLRAISHAESGRWHKGKQEIIAWPWTVYAEGRGRYLANKAAAIDEVQKLKAKGVSNIDVGCMQINLHFHPKAFENLDAALDPARNTRYAAELLKSLHSESRSWNMAVAHYHSRTQKYNIPYKQKVLKFWRAERRKDTDARMADARKTYRDKQAHLAARKKEASLRRFTQNKTPVKLADAGPS